LRRVCISYGFKDLEAVRAMLEATLAGRVVDTPRDVNPSVMTAMSLIADGYDSGGSEEDGEIDHDQLRRRERGEVGRQGGRRERGEVGTGERGGNRGAHLSSVKSRRRAVDEGENGDKERTLIDDVSLTSLFHAYTGRIFQVDSRIFQVQFRTI